MCFTVKYITQKQLKYAKRRSDSPDEISRIESELKELTLGMEPKEEASGFVHPPLLVFRNVNPLQPELFNWGLVPHWVKDVKSAVEIQKKTLNARGESIFEKPSFKKAAHQQRCLIMVDGFYDYHYIKNKPHLYFFEHIDKSPMVLAGLWDLCQTNDGITWNTVTIVTTKAYGLVREIQNNPKKSEQRSPLILNKNSESVWLANSSQPDIEEIINWKQQSELVVSGEPREMPGLWG